MVARVVGIEIPISKLAGKWKVSQIRTKSDRLGVASGLLARDDPKSKAMAGIVQRTIPSD